MDNTILPFQLDGAPVRGRLIRLGSVLDDILSAHDYSPALAAHTGEAALLTLVLSSLLKYEGIFTLQAQGDGPVSMIVADATSTGDLRACANIKGDASLPAQGSIGDFIGAGYIAFTVDQGPETERYQGIVELTPSGLKDSLLHYFTQSEQISTGITLALSQSDEGWRGGVIVVQEMPGEGGKSRPGNAEEDDWRRVMMLLQSCSAAELLDPVLGNKDLLFRLFHEETVTVFEEQAIRKGCRCSPEKLRDILSTLPQNDLDYMEEQGAITMRCEFCSRDFTFDKEEIGRDETASD